MNNLRKYGSPPFTVAVIHGGPGAPGEMASVAKELSPRFGVLEPLQTAKSVVGQVNELRDAIQTHGTPPVTLVGFSWGAWLSFITAALHPTLVKKLILIGSGPFEEHYADDIMKTRFSRMSEDDQTQLSSLIESLNVLSVDDASAAMAQFGNLIAEADAFTPLLHDDEVLEYQYDVYQAVWPEASKLRRSGQLLELGKQIQCPVVAIHGDYDPHPAEGVQDPLSQVIKDFKLIQLKDCGHRPWREQLARDKFYELLRKEC
jgi:pimeloyl-ACP methyl ester carboxylesterase